jgi:thiamine-monophosphate kinase
MSGAEPAEGVDEFDWIARLLRPLAAGAPEALNLADDAALIPSRPGYDLVISKDAVVAGVHFLADDPLNLVARKLLRVNLSDLAAKGAAPAGYLLAIAWPQDLGWAEREAFAAGLAADQTQFGLSLLGGDTVATSGPLTASVTILGWAPAGRMVRRSGAQVGDVVLVSGTIGDGYLGLKAARGDGFGSADDAAFLADRYRLPRPRTALAPAILETASASTDVSDGLIADAGHIAETSRMRVELMLERLPLSSAAGRWVAAQADRASALLALATGGDDYEIVCTASAGGAERLIAAGAVVGCPFTPIGQVVAGAGTGVSLDGAPLAVARAGYRHGGSSH